MRAKDSGPMDTALGSHGLKHLLESLGCVLAYIN